MGDKLGARAVVAAALVTLSTATAISGADPAQAAVAALADRAQVASSVRWSAVSSLTTTAPAAGSATVSGGGATTSQYVWVINNGTARLTTAGYSGRYRIAFTGIGLGRVDLLACLGATAAWNEATGVCTAGTSTVQASTDPAVPVEPNPSLPLAPGGMLRLRVSFVGVTTLTTAGVTVDVSRRAGAGTTTSS